MGSVIKPQGYNFHGLGMNTGMNVLNNRLLAV